jgi:hypothetical protein
MVVAVDEEKLPSCINMQMINDTIKSIFPTEKCVKKKYVHSQCLKEINKEKRFLLHFELKGEKESNTIPE